MRRSSSSAAATPSASLPRGAVRPGNSLAVARITTSARSAVSGPGPTWYGFDGGGSGGEGGAGGGGDAGGLGAVGRRSVSSPLTGPRQVVPLYGTLISLELTTCATPFSENGHEATLAMFAVPLTV